MDILKYKIIKTKEQYNDYCSRLELLLATDSTSIDEVELLDFLIEKWDKEHNSFEDLDPVQLLRSSMEEHKLKSKDLAEILDVSKGLISDIVNYKKGMSKEIIRKLAAHFGLSQEAFNRPYTLKSRVYQHLQHASM